MKCLTDDIELAFSYAPMKQCASCVLKDVPKCHENLSMLLKDAQYELNDGRILTVKKGFCFDGASLPVGVWTMLALEPYSYPILRAATFHDAVYASHVLSKSEADEGLYHLCENDDIGWLRRQEIWRAVQIFGARSWDKPAAQTTYFQGFVALA